MGKWIARIALLVTIAMVVAFAYLNGDTVTLDVYYARTELPLSVVVGIGFACGAILSCTVLMPVLLMRKRRLKRMARRLEQTETELANLRSEPMKDAH